MTSTVLVKLSAVPFPQGKKPSADIVTLPEKNEGSNQTAFKHQGTNMDKVAQLEQNMKFLQEQHQATLVALHQEVESLRQKNRDLQFQLVFSKGSAFVPSSPSSPEDNETGFTETKGSPVCVNITPLQVELLEKDLQDTKISLQEVKTQNQHLSEIIEEQKKKLSSTEEEKVTKQSVTDVGIQVDSRQDHVQGDLVACLEVAEAMVKRLHKQNEDQRKEIATLKAVSANAVATSNNKGARSRDNNNSHYSRGSPTSSGQEQSQNSQKFPPLQSQSYWHHRTPRNGRNRNDKQYHHQELDSTVLPQLQNGSAKSDTVIFKHPAHRYRVYRRYYENRKYKRQMSDPTDPDHHYHQELDSTVLPQLQNGSAKSDTVIFKHPAHRYRVCSYYENRKYKRHMSDPTDPDHHYHRRDYKDKNSKDHEKDLGDSVEESRESNNSSTSKS